MRRRIFVIINNCEIKKKPCFLNILAKELNLTHVAVKKHVDLLIEEGYVAAINPGGKPVYLKLTDNGKKILKEFDDKK